MMYRFQKPLMKSLICFSPVAFVPPRAPVVVVVGGQTRRLVETPPCAAATPRHDADEASNDTTVIHVEIVDIHGPSVLPFLIAVPNPGR